jgi:predicted SAM-dependent methyltransferase
MLDKYYNKIIKIYIRWKLFGLRFKCPFCGKSFRKFFPAGFSFPVLEEKNVVGGGYRPNALCPFCRSSDRERLIFLYLKKQTSVFSESIKLLHVAPEKNLQIFLKSCANIDYLSVDIDSPLAAIKMDISSINYENNSFDVIICNHVLEHIENDKRAMAEIYRVLKPGGWTILQVPLSITSPKTYEDKTKKSSKEREESFGQKDHVRIYGLDYKNRLEEAGFTVEIFDPIKEFGVDIVNKASLLKGENIYIGRKK